MGEGSCTACGAQVSEGAAFCIACGTAVQAAPPDEAAAAPPPPMPPEAAIPAQPATVPPAAMTAPAYAPPPAPAANPPWGKILYGLMGAGLFIVGAVKLYDAFYGAPVNSSTVRQLEDQIRHDFQARGQQVSQIQLTAQGRDQMTGSLTVGTPGASGPGLQYDCTAARQDASNFRYQCEPAGARIAAVASGTPARPETRTWRGSYTCGQGETGLEVTLRPAGQGRVEGTMSFFPLPTNASVPRGCYRVAGQVDAANQSIELRGGQWLRQPPGYHTVDLRGRIGADAGISGQVIGGECSQFQLQSVASPVEACP